MAKRGAGGTSMDEVQNDDLVLSTLQSSTQSVLRDLLASATLSGTPLWTLDRALRRAAERLDVFGEPGA